MTTGDITVAHPASARLYRARFLVAVRGSDSNAPPINIVVNWRALLNR
jgi:hypothetical protein